MHEDAVSGIHGRLSLAPTQSEHETEAACTVQGEQSAIIMSV